MVLGAETMVMSSNKAKGMMSDDNLKETYCLAFTATMASITDHYAKKLKCSAKSVSFIYKDGLLYLLRDGELIESVSVIGINNMFKSMDISFLRKKLRKGQKII